MKRSIDRKLGGRTSVHSKILEIQPIHREIHLRSRRRRTRTVKVWTALSRPCPAGETNNGQLFAIIRTADRIEAGKIPTDRHRTENPDRMRTTDRHRTRSSGQKRGKNRTRTVLSADVCWGVFHNYTNVRRWLTLDWFIKSISSNISAKPASFLNALNIFIIFFLILRMKKIVRVKNSPNSTFLSLNRSTITLIITVYHPKIWATGFIGSDGDDFGTFLAYHMIHIYDPYVMGHMIFHSFYMDFYKVHKLIFEKILTNIPKKHF